MDLVPDTVQINYWNSHFLLQFIIKTINKYVERLSVLYWETIKGKV